MKRSCSIWIKRRFPILFSVVFFLSGAAGCAKKAPVPSPAPEAALKKLGPMSYSIQVGAFTEQERAARLSAALDRQGLSSVYFFRDRGGLFKVRFGDFPARASALQTARSLLAKGIIDDYYIVAPDDHAAAKVRVYGEEYLRGEIVKTARGFKGIRYKWGAASPEDGFDCSGLTMAVYRLNGLNLPRSSAEQFKAGTEIGRHDIRRGDLVFFSIVKGRKISHVGVYTGRDRFIHAPGKGKVIREDSLDNGYYSKRYAGARTYFD